VKTKQLAIGVGVASLFAVPTLHAAQDRANVDPVAPLKPDQAVAWKATLGTYRDSITQTTATDVNLRGNTKDTKFWLGYYQDQDHFTQSRAGVEQSTSLASYGQLISSLQVASGGFVGGSITWDGKQDKVDGFSPLLGWGRTNVKTYYNLNFDPNDSVLWGGTYSQSQLGQWSLYQIFDDRLKTGQRVTHLVWRGTLPNAMGLMVDAFERSGASDVGEPLIKGNGVSVTVDVRNYFVRLAYDQKANFTQANITRLAVGFRF
jgi:hypothetical protein